MFNVQSHFKSKYFKFIALTVLSILIFLYLWKFDQLYICSAIFNNVFFIFWSGLDLYEYYWTFLVWFGFTIVSFLTNFAQSYLYIDNFPPRKFRVENRNPSYVNSGKCGPSSETSPVSKKEYKWLIFSWLNDGNVSNSKQLNAIKTLFGTSLSDSGWRYYFDFFTRLYRLDVFLSINSGFSTLSFVGYGTQKANSEDGLNALTYKTNSTSSSDNLGFFLLYMAKNYVTENKFNGVTSPSLLHITNTSLWNLLEHSRLSSNYENLLKKVNGLYYIHDLNYNTLMCYCNATLNVSQNMIATQLNSAKWDRWLYKYSLLHRKIFKNSHKLTLSKKLLNSTFYNTDLTKKNLWYSELLNKHKNSNLLHFTANLFQFNLANNSRFDLKQNKSTVISNNIKYWDNLLTLKTYENSFFWFLKRSYLFTNLFANYKYSAVAKDLNFHKNKITLSNQDSYFTIYSFLANNILTNLTVFNYLGTDLRVFVDENIDLKCHDLSLVFNDLDLFEKDNLEILISLTHLPIFLEHKSLLPYFGYYNFLTPNFQNSLTFYANNKSYFKLNNDFIFILNKNNLFHLNDILALLNIR